MSFILDALKKSEQERERSQTPGVVGLPYGRAPRGKPWWLIIVVGMLVLNCVLLLAMWLRKEATPVIAVKENTVTASASSSAASVVVAPPRTAEVRALDAEVINATEAEDSTSMLLSEATTPEGPPLVRSAADNAITGNSSNQTVINKYPVGQTGSGTAPTLTSLGGSAALNLPELRLDLHVYSAKKTERFAFINSKKYTEGQPLNEGPLLEQITNEGVVLSYRGQRFLVPRQ